MTTKTKLIETEMEQLTKLERNVFAFFRATQKVSSLDMLYEQSKQKYPELSKESGLNQLYLEARKKYAEEAQADTQIDENEEKQINAMIRLQDNRVTIFGLQVDKNSLSWFFDSEQMDNFFRQYKNQNQAIVDLKKEFDEALNNYLLNKEDYKTEREKFKHVVDLVAQELEPQVE
jgi:hypothetical protein